MSEFNAAKARTKRPCPIWVDAFHRDTQHLEADEIGGYFLILMAMWGRETCDFPDDPRRLAKVCRISKRLWDNRIGPVLMEFFSVKNGAVISKRLRQEAAYVERQVTQQSKRKVGKKHARPLENNDPPQTTDTSVENPSQQPNNLHMIDDDNARATLCQIITGNPDGQVGPSRCIGTQGDMLILSQWRDDLRLTLPEIATVVSEVMRSKGADPPTTFKYFTKSMQKFAGQKNAPRLEAINGGAHERPGSPNGFQRIIAAAAEGTSGKDWG